MQLESAIALLLLLSGSNSDVPVSAAMTDAGDGSAWQVIAPLFNPPPDLAKQPSSLRSPLVFEDGRIASTASDWAVRRQEILNNWHKLMGPWPALLPDPRLTDLSRTQREKITQIRVRVPYAEDQTSEGWLLLPGGPGPHPAALVVYYEPETSVGLNPKQMGRDFGWQLTQKGFVTLSIGTPGGNAWKPELGKAACQPLSFHAYVAANCWKALASRSDVDSKRIGIVGHSYGGKWALFGAALWEKFACVAVSDPGIVFDEARSNVNYWEPWYLGYDAQSPRPKAGLPGPANPRTGAYKAMRERGMDLHELHALLAPRPFFVSGGSEDPPERWQALVHAVAVNRLLGREKRVGMSNRQGHAPTPQSNAQLVAFFEHFLNEQP